MRVLKSTLVAAAVLAWVFVAFKPWDRISAGPPLEAPEAQAVAGDASILNQSEELAIPTDVEIVGEHLVLVDRRANQPIHVLHATSGELLRSIGRDGDGPGEYRALRSVSRVPGSATAFWAYDMADSRLTYVDLADEGALARPWDSVLFRLSAQAQVTGVEFASDHSIIAAGFFPDGRLGQFGPDGQMLRAFGELPSSSQEAPATVVQHAYMGTLKAHPNGSRMAIGLRHASWIEIRDADGAIIGKTELPSEAFAPLFEVAETEKGPMMRSDATLRFGYIDVAVTSSRIYGLYSGRTRDGYRGNANFGWQVHVFDWSGRLLTVIDVEQDLIAIAVKADGSKLYGVSHDPTPTVLSWSLDSPIKLAGL